MNIRLLPFLLIFLFLAAGLPAQVISIARARAMPVGSSVTVRGIVSNGAELGRTRYLQDGTAGIAAYPGQGSMVGFERSLKPGDSVEVSGVLLVYKNLLEISPVMNFRVLVPARILPKPQPVHINLAEIDAGHEGQLVRLDSLRFAGHRDTFSSNSVFEVVDPQGRKGKVYVQKDSPISGAPIPDAPLQLVAIVSRYNDFQLLPLNLQDYLPQEWRSVPYLDSSTVTSVLRIMNCAEGKISIKDPAEKEWKFSIAHSSGTTPLDLADLPAGAYLAVIRTHGLVFSLPFRKN